MTITNPTTTTNTTSSAGTASTLGAELVLRARACGPVLAAHAARHDRDGTWVQESFEHVRDSGLLSIGVPVELGGAGATIRDIAMVQRELAKHCASTALATAMHQHVTAFTAWRYRRALPGAEATLRRVADEGIVLVSTGGGDWTSPRGTATKVDGGYRVSGHKVFASQSPAGTVMSTMVAFDDPEQGRRVLNMSIPFASPGVQRVANWDAMGMRGTSSDDVVLDDVFVPDERVLANRPHGVVDPPLQVIASIAFNIVGAVYLGVAERALEHTIELVREKENDATAQRQIGLMSHRARIAAWALEGSLTATGDDPTPSMEVLAAVMAAKREIATAGIEICDLAMEVVGGPAYFRDSPIERAYRDIRAAKLHPFTPEATLIHAGRLALGMPCDR